MTALRLGRLDVQIDRGASGEGARVTLVGRIDDTSPISQLAPELAGGPVTIDTSGVTFLNSTGMREWLRLLRAVRAPGPITLERVADVLITQMNMIPELAINVRVTSFHAQYICPGCGAEVAPVVDAIAHAAELRCLVAPKLPCPECGAAMELGDFPERYLSIFRGN